MDPIEFNADGYRVAGQPFYLCSGELHYFRTPQADWRERLELLKAAGGNCVATYIPWLLHEPAEGEFCFGGDGRYDLEGFLRLAHELGLYVIARPGPYQYSELIYQGLPAWLCEGYPQIRALSLDGATLRESSVSYLHPTFLAHVRRWFAQIGPILARHTLAAGGPIAFVQLDNELGGVHEWFGGLDYHPASMGFGDPAGRYPRFLARHYASPAAMNAAYNTHFADFAAASPLEPKQAHTPADMRRVRDYFACYLGALAEYAATLAGLLRKQGVEAPLMHNAANPNMTAYFRETSAAFGENFLLGADHYYSLDQTWPQNHPTPQYLVKAFCSLEMLRLMGFPPTILELPGGSLADWPPFNATDASACYLAHLAFGMRGGNYYIFSGGENPPGLGVTSTEYDYGAAVGPRGDIRPVYAAQQHFGALLEAYPWLAEATRAVDVRFGLDWEQPRAHGYWRAGDVVPLSPLDAWKLLQQGPLTTALCAGLSPAFCDLSDDAWVADYATPLVVVAGTTMAAECQQRLVRFLQGGGQLLLLPTIPTLDEQLQPCTILAEALGGAITAPHAREVVQLAIADEPLVYGELFASAGLPAEAQVLGRDERSGQVAAWELAVGVGRAIVLGLRYVHAKHEHTAVLKALLGRLGLRPHLRSSNPNVWVALRRTGEHTMLFLINLLTTPLETDVAWRQNEGWRELGRYLLGPVSVCCLTITPEGVREVVHERVATR